jgi:hypothetical protein
MDETKSVLLSRTLWANAVGLLALAFGILGFDTTSLDAPALGEAAFQLVAAASFIASSLFRVVATERLRR